jgi:hypothetical protein
MKAKRKGPEIVLRKGKPAAVILDIEEYREMLERHRGCGGPESSGRDAQEAA